MSASKHFGRLAGSRRRAAPGEITPERRARVEKLCVGLSSNVDPKRPLNEDQNTLVEVVRNISAYLSSQFVRRRMKPEQASRARERLGEELCASGIAAALGGRDSADVFIQMERVANRVTQRWMRRGDMEVGSSNNNLAARASRPLHDEIEDVLVKLAMKAIPLLSPARREQLFALCEQDQPALTTGFTRALVVAISEAIPEVQRAVSPATAEALDSLALLLKGRPGRGVRNQHMLCCSIIDVLRTERLLDDEVASRLRKNLDGKK